MKTVSIIGYGRFGKVLHRMLRDDFAVTLYQRHQINDTALFTPNTVVAQSLPEVYANDVIFYSVPIENFDSLIADHQKYFRENHVLIDVLSVKMHPETVFRKYLRGTKIQAILTHPMFGPDSSADGFGGLPIIMDQFLASTESYSFWKNYFTNKQLSVIELSPKEHDRLAANSQGLTHFVGRMLDDFGLHAGPIDSQGTKKLVEVVRQTCNDTWQLFSNLQHYNPYTKPMRLHLEKAHENVFRKLLPKRVDPAVITYGIQGGKGSFNEEAALYQLKRSNVKKYVVKYLFTSEKVLSSLHEGLIDVGQFAIHNSAGGVVQESIEAMARYKFVISQQFAIKISHALMIRSDAKLAQVDTIMTHPQVLAQCKKTLSQKYPTLLQTSGKGIMVDHAMVAKKLGAKLLPKNVAVMGSKVLAELYGLTIVEGNLQDLKENYTTFLQVKRN